MPKSPAETASPPAYDPETTYDVRLRQVVRVGTLKLLPRNEHQLLGSALNALVAEHGQDIVDAATPVE